MNKSNILWAFMLIGSMAIQADSSIERLFEAVKNNDITKVKQLLQAGTNVDARDKLGATALMYAAHKKGNLDMIKLLLEAGADVNAASTYYDEYFDLTPLESAILGQNIPAMQLLLDSGADPNRLDSKMNETVLMAALRNEAPLDIIKLLIDKGALVQAQAPDGRTPLMVAVQSGSLEAVKLLIEKGAPVNAKDANGATALSRAKNHLDYLNQWGETEQASETKLIIELLEKEGAK